MRNYRIKIELLSDMCVSDGGIYNSAIDTDICYDEYGFPYIPAKRLKGCLRECALELKDVISSICQNSSVVGVIIVEFSAFNFQRHNYHIILTGTYKAE